MKSLFHFATGVFCSSFPRKRESSDFASYLHGGKSLDPRLRGDDGNDKRALRAFAWCALFALLAFAGNAFAQAGPAAAATPSLPSVNVGQIGGAPVSMPLQVLLLMTGITISTPSGRVTAPVMSVVRK